MPPRSAPMPAGKPLSRTGRLRRAAIVRAVAAATAPARRRKASPGEFPPRVRALLWHRFCGRCAVCGDALPRKGWTAQHRRARGIGGSTAPATRSPANGIAVHEIPCHRHIEDHPAEALATGWRVPQSTDPATVPVLIWTGERVHLHTDGSYEPVRPEEGP